MESPTGRLLPAAMIFFFLSKSCVQSALWRHRVYDIRTGEELVSFQGHGGVVNALAFARDGKSVASASADSTARIWDMTKLKRPAVAVKALQPSDLDKHCKLLADNDAAKAFDAICTLATSPTDAVSFLKDRLKPATPPDRNRLAVLIGQRPSPRYFTWIHLALL